MDASVCLVSHFMFKHISVLLIKYDGSNVSHAFDVCPYIHVWLYLTLIHSCSIWYLLLIEVTVNSNHNILLGEGYTLCWLNY